MLGDTLRKDYPLLKRTVYCRIEGSGKAKKVRVVSVDLGTDDTNLQLHFEGKPTTNHQATAAMEYQKQTKKHDRREGAKMVETGVASTQEEAVVMVRGAGPKPAPDPLERASKRNRGGGGGTRGPLRAGQSADIITLVRVLEAYGYTIIASPAYEKNPNAGCRRCVHSGNNRANILACTSGIRVDFLPRSGFIETGKKTSTPVPLIETFATKKIQGWTFVGAAEDGSGYKHVHYHGPITQEVMKAFGLDPGGKTPDQMTEGKVALDWVRHARTAKVNTVRKSSPEDMENLKKRRTSMFTE